MIGGFCRRWDWIAGGGSITIGIGSGIRSGMCRGGNIIGGIGWCSWDVVVTIDGARGGSRFPLCCQHSIGQVGYCIWMMVAILLMALTGERHDDFVILGVVFFLLAANNIFSL